MYILTTHNSGLLGVGGPHYAASVISYVFFAAFYWPREYLSMAWHYKKHVSRVTPDLCILAEIWVFAVFFQSDYSTMQTCLNSLPVCSICGDALSIIFSGSTTIATQKCQTVSFFFFDRVCCSEAISQNKSNIHACLWETNSSLWFNNHRKLEGFELGILIGACMELESRF